MAGEAMDFPDTFEEFAEGYGIRDSDEVYTNGSLLIPVFRVRQWLSHLGRERVVRCRDCRRSFEERGELWCRGIVGPPVEPDGFCAWGKPREES